ncbi:MAG: flavoprotein [Patescibacteria group bacterium]|jgi:hypothetical protein
MTKNKVLLGLTGSVASKLDRQIVAALKAEGCEVIVVPTIASLYFSWSLKLEFVKALLASKLGLLGRMLARVIELLFPSKLGAPVVTDAAEWRGLNYKKNMPIEHIVLRDWADVLVIAPLSANTLGKIANGLADNLLTCIVRAWDPAKPVVLAPAMNTKMWQSSFTATHLQSLKNIFQLCVVPPVSKKLACGDEGVGALAAITDIVAAVGVATKSSLDVV